MNYEMKAEAKEDRDLRARTKAFASRHFSAL